MLLASYSDHGSSSAIVWPSPVTLYRLLVVVNRNMASNTAAYAAGDQQWKNLTKGDVRIGSQQATEVNELCNAFILRYVARDTRRNRFH